MPEGGDNSAALAALERFVVENDDLLALEERIGRFNVFDALRVARREIRHSNFLAWLLDPAESHGQGDVFLQALLMDLLRKAPRELRPLGPLDLDGADLSGVEVHREWRGQVDVLLTGHNPKFVLAIENKIDSAEHDDQLDRYEQLVRSELKSLQPFLVYLTVAGDEPSSPRWMSYSYGDIHRVLRRVVAANTRTLGEDVRVFLSHYLRLLEGLMNDPELDALCKRIYQNHRTALEVIFQRLNLGQDAVLPEIAQALQSASDQWLIVSDRGKKWLGFLPHAWLDVLPPIGTRASRDSRAWLAFWFEIVEGVLCLSLWTTDVSDKTERDRVLVVVEDLLKGAGLADALKGRRDSRERRLWRRQVADLSEMNTDDRPAVVEEAVRLAHNAAMAFTEMTARLAK